MHYIIGILFSFFFFRSQLKTSPSYVNFLYSKTASGSDGLHQSASCQKWGTKFPRSFNTSSFLVIFSLLFPNTLAPSDGVRDTVIWETKILEGACVHSIGWKARFWTLVDATTMSRSFEEGLYCVVVSVKLSQHESCGVLSSFHCLLLQMPMCTCCSLDKNVA